MKIRDLRKTYILKYESVEALKGVSFDLPEKGMVFILGKSGCGKSTLLNILSGLDDFDGGDIIYNGRSLKNFSKTELDSYRNSCCGFVFQEYNLIPELNVFDNIALAIEMQGKKDIEQKVKIALKNVGLESYEGRKVTELSGGQKQRIAIARSIIKNPQIIFADEPSGALDSETGASIFELLKEFSKEKLIIVVSHDRESAEKYGDRIIELSDGHIISDTDKDYVEEESEHTYKVCRSKMPIKSALRIGCSNFKFHPFRLIATVFLAMIAFSFLGISLNPVVDDISSIAYSTMIKNDLHQSALVKHVVIDGNDTPLLFTEKDRQEVAKRAGTTLQVVYCENGIENSGETQNPYYTMPRAFSCITESAIEQYGFTVYKYLPKNENEIAVTQYIAELLCDCGISDGRDIMFCKNPNDLVGKTLIVDGREYIISGIIDTKFDTQKYMRLKQSQNDYGDIYSRFISELNFSAHNMLFINDIGSCNENLFEGYPYLIVKQDLIGRSNFDYFINHTTESGISYRLTNYVVDTITGMKDKIGMLKNIMIYLAVVFAVFSILLLLNFMLHSVNEKTNTIGVLKSLGSSNFNLIKIFIWEGLIVGALVFISSLVGLALLGWLFSLYFSSMYGNVYVAVFGVSPTVTLILFCIIVVFALIGCILPIARLSKLKPMEYLNKVI